MATASLGTIDTSIPARLDRLPWSRWHWRIVIGLGTVWILDGLEVTVVGSVSGAIGSHGSGVNIASADVAGLGATMYVLGACVGALLFGQLTDRFGRKRLFMITLGVYLSGALLTAFTFAPIWFFACRFITGLGIGGEYSAINSAIDELIPAKVRGRIDIVINGTYWAGAAAGALLAVLAQKQLSTFLSWRVCFALGVVLGLGILLVRRHVPESPRWLFIHGREREAEEIVGQIEREVTADVGVPLADAEGSMRVHQRRSIGVVEAARAIFRAYPRRSILGFFLFFGQAALYNSILFGYTDVLTTFFHVDKSNAPYYLAVFAVGNLIGPLMMGHLFDTVGRKPMIAGTYILSGVLLLITGYLFNKHQLNATTLTIAWSVVFFFASAGVSAAYLTVSEIFPMETRGLAIAIFYAIGTGAGGFAPLIFSGATKSGDAGKMFLALAGGAVLMIAGGVAELLLGVRAERKGLEDIATPLSAAEPVAAATG